VLPRAREAGDPSGFVRGEDWSQQANEAVQLFGDRGFPGFLRAIGWFHMHPGCLPPPPPFLAHPAPPAARPARCRCVCAGPLATFVMLGVPLFLLGGLVGGNGEGAGNGGGAGRGRST
jgi:hypothetical protein